MCGECRTTQCVLTTAEVRNCSWWAAVNTLQLLHLQTSNAVVKTHCVVLCSVALLTTKCVIWTA